MIRYLEKELRYLEAKDRYLTHIVKTSNCPKCIAKKKKCLRKKKALIKKIEKCGCAKRA